MDDEVHVGQVKLNDFIKISILNKDCPSTKSDSNLCLPYSYKYNSTGMFGKNVRNQTSLNNI